MTPYYDYGGIQIFLGDCRDVLPELPNFDLLLTDPPYGLGAARKNFGGNGVKRRMTGLVAGKAIPKRDYGDNDWDDVVADDELISLCRSKATWQIIFGGNYFTLPPSKCWLIWDKMRGDTDYADAELAWTNLDNSVRRLQYRWNGFLVEPGCTDVRVHPCQKPLSVCKWAISMAPDVKTLIDPFLGSGTILVAAKAMGLTGIGIESHEPYAEIAANRLRQEVFDFEPDAIPLSGQDEDQLTLLDIL